MAYAACDLDQIETQTDMNLRSYESYQDAEKKLTEVYRALLKRTFKESRPKLIAAQRAWIKWRDADCAFELDGQGGSIRPFVTNLCYEAMTLQRVEELSNWLNCPEGVVNCPPVKKAPESASTQESRGP